MLDSDTKRRIDTARDILVGKVPDPMSQVEQITIALIYKFMDDMDAESEEFGGKRSFFAGEFARYGWTKLMRAGLGGHETLNLYAESITKMPENPGIPPLFRDIFNNAYLPYRDPETLRAFLKIIDEFTYDHSERLGDAFEYLLSVLGSQGDAGQFRTPRHIIDFIVAIIDPRKGETVLDPACGTAGFLISSYKHILAANTDPRGDSTLTPDDKGWLAANFSGYDISPDMVRLSLVNLYLHGFADPHIFEYDTLTSEEYWNEYADVILANPPFMSPTGGIRPHNRFSVKSKRSEALFVDYMAEHLTSSGRAGIIVPEGIIFQSQNAYKQLRKMLVEESLVVVVSLPAGVFNPYSGVKTSILILDKSLAKKTDRIAFFKVGNDGFDLGAQRREIDKDDLPQVQDEIGEYLRRLRVGEVVDDFKPPLGLLAEKGKIAANGDYNLSGERYRVSTPKNFEWPMVELGEVCDVFNGSTPSRKKKEYWENGTVPWFTVNDIRKNGRIIRQTIQFTTNEALEATSLKLLPRNTVLLCCTASVGEYALAEIELTTNQQFNGLVVKKSFSERLSPKYLFHLSAQFKDELLRLSGKTSFDFVSGGTLKTFQIPLPPLEVQKEIVAEIEGYQKVIDGARAVVDNYRPHIPIDPAWPMVELSEVADFVGGYAFKSSNMTDTPLDSTYRPVVKIGNVGKDGRLHMTGSRFHIFHAGLVRFALEVDDILIAMTGATVGKVAVVDCPDLLLNQRVGVIRAKSTVFQRWLLFLLRDKAFYNFCQRTAAGGAQGNIAPREILSYLVALPPLDVQKEIVAEIEAEQTTIDANCDLIARFKRKISATIGRVWGEDKMTGV